jgi:hypothetical protein
VHNAFAKIIKPSQDIIHHGEASQIVASTEDIYTLYMKTPTNPQIQLTAAEAVTGTILERNTPHCFK